MKIRNLISLFIILITFPLIADNKKDYIAREQVDLVEYNHFYDEYGRLVFDQNIWYDWNDNLVLELYTEVDEIVIGGRYNVRAWRLVKTPNLIPYKDWERGGYTSFWADGEQIRDINAKEFRETWTQYDPELVEREFLPKEKRKELQSTKIKKK